MSIDRTKNVYDIVQPFLNADGEGITLSSIEEEGIYSMTVVTGSFVRSTAVCATITQKLVENGFAPTNIDMAQVGDAVLMDFRINVGKVRSLDD